MGIHVQRRLRLRGAFLENACSAPHGRAGGAQTGVKSGPPKSAHRSQAVRLIRERPPPIVPRLPACVFGMALINCPHPPFLWRHVGVPLDRRGLPALGGRGPSPCHAWYLRGLRGRSEPCVLAPVAT